MHQALDLRWPKMAENELGVKLGVGPVNRYLP